MPITPVTSVTIPARPKEQNADRPGKPEETAGSRIEASRQGLNRAILQKSMDASLSAGNDPLALLFKTAIEEINEVLAPQLGPNAIQKTYESGLDMSPEATAERIVSLSTAFFGTYHLQHPDKDEETAVRDFVELIGSGIERGFSEAREILQGLGVLEGEIAANIDTTHDLVQEGLKSFGNGFTTTEKQ